MTCSKRLAENAAMMKFVGSDREDVNLGYYLGWIIPAALDGS